MLPFKYRIVLISCLVLVTTRAETGRASDDAATPGEAIAAKYSSGVIFLTCYNGPSDQTVGTGFLISDDIIITNNHVIARAHTVTADFYGNSETRQCELLAENEDLDLAALKLSEKTAGTYPVLVLSDDPYRDARQGAEVFLIGSYVKLRNSFIPGTVSSHTTLGELFRSEVLKIAPRDEMQRIIQLNVNSNHGMSGAPVLNRRGQVVGVQQMGRVPGEGSINFCIPADYINRLDRTQDPRKFGGGMGGPLLVANLQALGMRAEGFVQPAPEPFPIRTRAWGFVPNDADLIYNSYVEDKFNFARILCKDRVVEMINRGGGNPILVHLTNPLFRYSIVSPNWFHLEDFPSPDGLSIKSVLSYDDPAVPQGRNDVSIFARKVGPPPVDREELIRWFAALAAWSFQNELGLQEIDPNNAPPNPTILQVARNQGMSDNAPRVHESKPSIRFMRIVDAHPAFDTSYFVLHGLTGDTFATLAFRFSTTDARKQMDWSADWVDRLFIAGTLSFFD